ncbi:uncharacterized protein LOC135401154 [Ornithodoros turicata]|uniref:uncharacterized protein LOC135401154 n=1 Tax=Ornithodoros turicata TaxID=34597 RepID=UPI0031390261
MGVLRITCCIFLAVTLGCAAMPVDEDKNSTTCKLLFPPAIPFGMKFFQHMPAENREKHMACYNISKQDAMQRDESYERQKKKCLELVLPDIAAEMREMEACKIAAAGTNMSGSVFWTVGQIRRCIADYVLFPEEDQDELDLESIKMHCLEEAFPSLSAEDKVVAFKNLTKQAKMLGHKYFDLRDKLDICMHKETLHMEDQEEYKTNLPHCQAKLFPGRTMSQVEEELDRSLREGNYSVHSMLYGCVYMMSSKARWELQNFHVVQRCAEEVHANVSSDMKRDVEKLYEKYMANATIDKMMECHSRRLQADTKKMEDGQLMVVCRPPNYAGHAGKQNVDRETLMRRNVVTRMVGDCIRRHGPTEVTTKYEEKLKRMYNKSNAAAECVGRLFRPNVFRQFQK